MPAVGVFLPTGMDHGKPNGTMIRLTRMLRHVRGSGIALQQVSQRRALCARPKSAVLTTVDIDGLRAFGRTVIVIDGVVYDVSSFLQDHPGGGQVITAEGVDCTDAFHVAGHSAEAHAALTKYKIGEFSREHGTATSDTGASAVKAPPPPTPHAATSSPAAPPTDSRHWFNGGKPLPLEEHPFPGPPGDRIQELAANLANQAALYIRWVKRYGPIVQVTTQGEQRFLIIADPDVFTHASAATLLKPTELAAQRRDTGGEPPARRSFYDKMVQVFGTGVLFVDEATWAPRRKYLQPAFSVSNLAETTPLVVSEASAMLDRLAEAESSGAAVDVKDHMFQTAFNIIVRAALGEVWR